MVLASSSGPLPQTSCTKSEHPQAMPHPGPPNPGLMYCVQLGVLLHFLLGDPLSRGLCDLPPATRHLDVLFPQFTCVRVFPPLSRRPLPGEARASAGRGGQPRGDRG